MTTMTRDEMIAEYCTRQDVTPEDIRYRLDVIAYRDAPDGFMLLECQDFASSHMGSYVMLPYGPKNTYHAPPTHPVSPRGLASDMSVVVATCPAR